MILSNGAFEELHYDEGTYFNVSIGENLDTFPNHWHTATEILMALDEDYHVSINNQNYHLKEGDLLFIAPGELHEMCTSCEGTHMVLQFDFSLISKLKDFQSILPILRSLKHLSKAENPVIQASLTALLLEIKSERANSSMFSNAQIYSKLINLYVIIAREYSNASEVFFNLTHTKQHDYVIKFSQVLTYIDNHLNDPLTLESLAEVAGFSKFHFTRLFKQFTDSSPKSYIQQQRISKAEQLLLNPNLNITEVALQSGFNSLSTFNRVFKDYKGCSPTAFKDLYVQL